MRVVMLCSSPYSETCCAMAARLAQLGHVPCGAITLPSWDSRTLRRKLGQVGARDFARFAWSKLKPRGSGDGGQLRNPRLRTALQHQGTTFRNLYQVGGAFKFPVFTGGDQNSRDSVAQMKAWVPDVAVFTGGNILREQILAVPRLGIINAHLALLPEIRGMSSPEWSMMCRVPLGITIHRIDRGIDTGPILLRREFTDTRNCESFTDLRNRMIAAGIEMVGEVIRGLEQGTIVPAPQRDVEADHQYFVMHERLKAGLVRQFPVVQNALPAGEADE